MNAPTDDSYQQREMSLIDHLAELRMRLIVSLAAVSLYSLGAFFFAKPALQFLTLPIKSVEREPGRDTALTIRVETDGALRLEGGGARPDLPTLARKRLVFVWPADPERDLPALRVAIGDERKQQFVYQSPLDPVMLLLKVALMLGLTVALPICLWQLWLFVAPGLKLKERQVVKPMLAGALILFPLGAGFAYGIISLMLVVMQRYTVENVGMLLNINEYLSLLTTMMLVFGVIFELPLVLAIAARIGLVTPEMLTRFRRHAYVVVAFLAMVLTPADPFSMIAALIPLIALYEVSILLARPMARRHRRDLEEAET